MIARVRRQVSVRLRTAMSGDDGAVTVEAALGIASIVTVLVLAVGGMASALVQVRVVDAARESARVAAYAGAEEGRRAGRAAAPDGARIEVTVGDSIVAEVSVRGMVPGLTLSARSVARPEPGT